ncbi:hypothetical protein MAE02_34380 [Microvirga aerophila]|uniref:ABC transporter substrate-binding protein n=2 Tax=Microvirga aerophila TaxID=670291 RepID=A0A512BUW8_9HYPH|nr:hypothetical protein MAE02_34380 [Microvirga aerophila]
MLQRIEMFSSCMLRPSSLRRTLKLCAQILALIWMVFLSIGWPAGSPRAAEPTRRVIHVDSYHQGNEWNDRILTALQSTLKDKNVELRVVYLDAKRRSSNEEIKSSAENAKRIIDEFKPDVVTISDDPAAQYLVMGHLRDVEIPVLFCGLNWDASVYGLPYRNTSGMVEVSPIPQIIRLLRQHARGSRLGFLAEDTDVKRKELEYHQRLFGITYERAYFVRSHAEWKDAFLRAQQEVDMLLILGVGALPDWDPADARKFAEEKSQIPSGTDFEWLTPVTLIGVAKYPEEQGRWLAQAALRVLEGVRPSDIPLTYNREGELFFNARIGKRLGVMTSPPLARIVP